MRTPRQLVKGERRCRRCVTDRIDDVARLGKGFGGLQPAAADADTSGNGAADAEAASRQDLRSVRGHRKLLFLN